MSTLPTLQELHHDTELAFKNDQLNTLLNQPAPQHWLKQHPFANKEVIEPNGSKRKVPLDYLPIDKVEFLLTRIFQHWRVEVISCSALFNSVCCHVRVHYLHPITNEWMYHDGIGAVGIQTDAGASAADMSKIKQDAVMKAAPAAKSYAIKDAAEHLGSLFGRDLNRKDTVAFTGSYQPKNHEHDRLRKLIEMAATAEDLTVIQPDINHPLYQLWNDKMNQLESA